MRSVMLGRRRATPLEEHLGHRFRDPDLLDLAFAHRSWANEQGREESYERLEFLGDAVLGLVTAEWLYERYPELPEGDLSRRKAVLVSQPMLARHAESLGLGDLLRLGVGEERSGGRRKASLLADALEAVFGAVYVDAGMEPARRAIRRFLEEAAAERDRHLHVDAKTRLQELTQAHGWDLPEYLLVEAAGPDHRKLFTIECRVAGESVGRGEGTSKKLAEQRAAAAALKLLAERA